MMRPLAQGLIGRRQRALLPSAVAVGPNRYLDSTDFFKMLGIAFAAHALIFLIAGLFPSEKVTNIPVRALSFKLGDQDRVAALGSSGIGVQMNTAPAPAMGNAAESWRASPAVPRPRVALRPEPVKAPKIVPIPDAPRSTPVENLPAPTPIPTPVPTPQPVSPTLNGLPNPALLNQPAVAPNPQQYVREVGAAPPGAADGQAGGQGTATTGAEQVQQIRERYEQQISGWIQLHKLYPASAGGRSGRAVVRMRIDRAGVIRYYAIEQSSGIPVIDDAAIDMIRRANPVPAVPANYPAGNLIEFLIPLNFAP